MASGSDSYIIYSTMMPSALQSDWRTDGQTQNHGLLLESLADDAIDDDDDDSSVSLCHCVWSEMFDAYSGRCLTIHS